MVGCIDGTLCRFEKSNVYTFKMGSIDILKSGWHVLELFIYSMDDKCESDATDNDWLFIRNGVTHTLTLEHLLQCRNTIFILGVFFFGTKF